MKNTIFTLLLAANLFLGNSIFGQELGDYRSIASGNWTALSSWQYYDGSQWTTPTSYPGDIVYTTGDVLIQQGHVITLDAPGGVGLSTVPFLGTVTISGKLTVNGLNNTAVIHTLFSKKIVVTENLTPIATIEFLDKSILSLPENATINVGPGGLSGDCSNNNEIWIGRVEYAVCAGGGNQLLIFDDIMALGGTGNADANSPVCLGNPIQFYATTPPNGDNYTFAWSGPNGWSSTLQNPVIPNAQLNDSGEYTVLMTYANKTITANTKVIVNNGTIPNPPTIGTITFDCLSSTASVELNGLPLGAWKLVRSPGGEETYGIGTSKTISGLSAGTYTFTVSNVAAGSCTSLASAPVVISSNTTSWKSDAVDSSWTNAANWSCGVPSSNSDVTINSGANQPVISSKVIINSLSLLSGTSLKVNSGFNLKVLGAITNEGTLTIENNANLVQTGGVDANSGSGNAIVKRESNALYRYDYTMWSSPVTGSQSLLDFSPLTNTTRFYTYDSSPEPDVYVSIASPSTTAFAKGIGYLIRMPNTDPTLNYEEGTATLIHKGTFTGTLNNGPVTLSGLTPNSYYAIGNPYPSTIYATAFNLENATTGVFYFWRKKNNSLATSYATYTNFAGVANSGDPNALVPNGIIQVGQGFIVQPSSTALRFRNFMRTQNNSNQILKTKSVEKHRIWLNLSEGSTPVNQIVVGYMSGATMGNDYEMDGAYINDSQTALNSLINNDEFVIQARSLPFDGSDVIPLAFKTTVDGNFTIAVDHFDGLFLGSQDIILKDASSGVETDLKSTAYTFAAKAGTDNNRFSLKFQKTLGVKSVVFDESSVLVYKNKGVLHIKSTTAISDVKVYDIQGRLLFEKMKVDANETALTSSKFGNQVLIVKITSQDNKVVNKKIVN